MSDWIDGMELPEQGPQPVSAPALLTVEHAAGFLDLSVPTIRRLILDRELRAVRIGRAVRVRFDDLVSFIDRHTEEEP